MRCPSWPKVTLTPLQARLLASLATLALVALVYWSLSNPQFAYAAEIRDDGREDHNWHRIQAEWEADETLDKRATQQEQVRGNNIATPYDLASGNMTTIEYPNTFLVANHTDKGKGLPKDPDESTAVKVKHLELRKRQDSDSNRTIYISANTCSQPTWNGSETQTAAPPQLTLYVSTSAGNTQLGPSLDTVNQTVHPFVNGYVKASVSTSATETTGSWYMSVSAPALPDGFAGSWNYELAVSIDDYYFAADLTGPFLYQIDTDIDSALLVTGNLTDTNASSPVYQEWMDLSPPYIMFASNRNLSGLMGMESSFCGLKNFKDTHNQIQASQSDLGGNGTGVQMGMTTRGLGHKPKQQFFLNKLNASSAYRAFLAMEGNSTAYGERVVRGGGKVWAPVDFQTKSDGNCQLLFNLTFCDEVAYAVPANPKNPAVQNLEALQNFYENYTTYWYEQFNYTLAQIPCNTTSDAQYSLAKNCTDCASAYKEWLCAVSIPRCEDFTNPASHLQKRNMGQQFYNNASMLSNEQLLEHYEPMSKAPTLEGSNAYQQTFASSFATNRSRNYRIDEVIQPGPYKEVLPCEDLCYSLMQSCPSSMQFVCPYPGRGLEASYGQRNGGNLTCSFLGAFYYTNGAVGIELPVLRVFVFAALAGVVLAFV